MIRSTLIVLCQALVLGGCTAAGSAPGDGPLDTPELIGGVAGFDHPETVLYDPEQDQFFVSAMVGNPTTKDGNGAVYRIAAESPERSVGWIRGGTDGVTLHGPKGMAIQGDILWVADIDAVRGFDRRSGRPLATIDLAPHDAVSVNDLAAHPDGSLYVTDLRLRFTDRGEAVHHGADRIYRVSPRGEVTVAVAGDTLAQPNGIVWDPDRRALVFVPLRSRAIFAWRPGEEAPRVIARGPGGFDGVRRLPGVGLVISSVVDGSVFVLRGQTLTPLLNGLRAPANLGVDTRRRRLAIPLVSDGRVEFWQLRR